MERIQEAAELCLEFERQDIPSPEFIGIQKILVTV
jgi:predicted RNase H-like HicB family nuclease